MVNWQIREIIKLWNKPDSRNQRTHFYCTARFNNYTIVLRFPFLCWLQLLIDGLHHTVAPKLGDGQGDEGVGMESQWVIVEGSRGKTTEETREEKRMGAAAATVWGVTWRWDSLNLCPLWTQPDITCFLSLDGEWVECVHHSFTDIPKSCR